MQETRETPVLSLSWEDNLEKEMATHSSILVWKIIWTEEPGKLQSLGSERVGRTKWLSIHVLYTLCLCGEEVSISVVLCLEGCETKWQKNILKYSQICLFPLRVCQTSRYFLRTSFEDELSNSFQLYCPYICYSSFSIHLSLSSVCCCPYIKKK